MIKNLKDYFDVNQEFYLDKVSYRRIETQIHAERHLLNCNDRIEVKSNENIVKLTVERTLKCDPEEMFELSVSYGAILKFKEDNKNDYNWSEINLSEEFKENGEFVLRNLLNRMSLLIAEITSSFGQSPIVLPPAIISERRYE